jgi:hypothetical protein
MEIEFGQCLLSFSPEMLSSRLLFKNVKNYNKQNYRFAACWFRMGAKLGL